MDWKFLEICGNWLVSLASESVGDAPGQRRRGRKGGVIWVWLKMRQEGQTAGFGFHVSTYQGSILEFRFFEPQPFAVPTRNLAGSRGRSISLGARVALLHHVSAPFQLLLAQRGVVN